MKQIIFVTGNDRKLSESKLSCDLFGITVIQEVAQWFTEKDFINLIQNKEDNRIMFSENITYFDGTQVVRFSKDYWGKIVLPRELVSL
jgi:hypothetical protein